MSAIGSQSLRFFGSLALTLFLSITPVVMSTEPRPRPVWTFKKLMEKSEFVCIGAVKSTKVIANTRLSPEFLEAMESEIVVVSILKGDAKIQHLRFIHFHYRDDISSTLGNGPSFALLRSQKHLAERKDLRGPAEIGEDKEMKSFFLFYLTRREDGSYGPTSGDMDASISVAEILGDTDDAWEVKKQQRQK